MKDNANGGDYSKTETDWIQPKKSIPITCFFKKCKNQEDNVKVNNKCNMLIEECDNEEEEDECMKEEGLEEKCNENEVLFPLMGLVYPVYMFSTSLRLTSKLHHSPISSKQHN